MVPILFHSTTRTDIRPAGQRHLLPMATGGTGLTCVGRIHLLELTTSIFSFVREKEEKLRPRHITDRTVHTAMRVHFIHGDVFDEDLSVLIHDLRRFLVGKVGALIRNTLVNFCHDLFGLCSFRRSFLLKFQFSLRLGQSLCGLFQKLRISNLRSIRKSGKGFDPDIDPHRKRTGRKNVFMDSLAGKSHPPFPGRRPENVTGLDLALYRAVENIWFGQNVKRF